MLGPAFLPGRLVLSGWKSLTFFLTDVMSRTCSALPSWSSGKQLQWGRVDCGERELQITSI